jgi:glycosyltransferase involved in cell wall biosynthesis
VRLLLISSVLPPKRIPEADYSLLLAAELASRAHEVHLVTDIDQEGAFQGLTVHRPVKDWTWSSLPRLAGFIWRLNPDAVVLMYEGWLYAFHPMITILPSVTKRLRRRSGFVSVLHAHVGATPLPVWQKVVRPLSWLTRSGRPDAAFGTLFTESDHVICLSQGMNDVFTDLFPAAADRTIIVPPPNMLRMAADPAAARRRARDRFGLTADAFAFTFFGYVYGSKGVEYLIDALALVLPRTRRDVRLVMLGGVLDGLDGPEYLEILKSRAAERGVAGRIVWAGGFDWNTTEASEGLFASDACVFPFKHGIQISNSSVAAAMAHGLPSIASADEATDCAFVDRQNICLVPPTDADALSAAMLGLLENHALRQRLAAGARAMAAEWLSPAEVAARVESVLVKSVNSLREP